MNPRTVLFPIALVMNTWTGAYSIKSDTSAPIRRQHLKGVNEMQLDEVHNDKQAAAPKTDESSDSSLLASLLDGEPKPWFNVTARHAMHNLVAKHGNHIWGNSWRNTKNWLVVDGLLSESECKQLRDDMDARETKTWAQQGAQETSRFTTLGQTTQKKDQYYLSSSDFVKDGEKCSKMEEPTNPEDKAVKLFLKARRLMTTAARTFFNEGHMIHPEHTTAQRRSRPNGNNELDQWYVAHNIHQGVHADNCQISFMDTEDSFCSPNSNAGFIQRSHTAVMYLSGYEHSTGGELFFTDISSIAPPNDKRLPIPLKCGRLVVFESTPQNLHGVQTFLNGSRYAIDLWMTTQPDHFEYTHNFGLGKCAKWEGEQ